MKGKTILEIKILGAGLAQASFFEKALDFFCIQQPKCKIIMSISVGATISISMSITDLTTTKKPDSALRLKILAKIGEQKPYNCFQCIRCTSGCPSMKMLELKPHEIVSLVKLGFIEELLTSGILWTCATCLKCKERCPQDVAPVDLIFALRNLAVEKEVKVPESFLHSLSAILENGFIQKPQNTVTRKLKRVNREKLGLPKFREPDEKFKAALFKVLEQSQGE